jgi:hypothetical protein
MTKTVLSRRSVPILSSECGFITGARNVLEVAVAAEVDGRPAAAAARDEESKDWLKSI